MGGRERRPDERPEPVYGPPESEVDPGEQPDPFKEIIQWDELPADIRPAPVRRDEETVFETKKGHFERLKRMSLVYERTSFLEVLELPRLMNLRGTRVLFSRDGRLVVPQLIPRWFVRNPEAARAVSPLGRRETFADRLRIGKGVPLVEQRWVTCETVGEAIEGLERQLAIWPEAGQEHRGRLISLGREVAEAELRLRDPDCVVRADDCRLGVESLASETAKVLRSLNLKPLAARVEQMAEAAGNSGRPWTRDDLRSRVKGLLKQQRRAVRRIAVSDLVHSEVAEMLAVLKAEDEASRAKLVSRGLPVAKEMSREGVAGHMAFSGLEGRTELQSREIAWKLKEARLGLGRISVDFRLRPYCKIVLDLKQRLRAAEIMVLRGNYDGAKEIMAEIRNCLDELGIRRESSEG